MDGGLPEKFSRGRPLKELKENQGREHMRRDTHYAHPDAGEWAREGGEGDEREGDTEQEGTGKPSARRSNHKPEERGEQGKEMD